MGDHGVVRDVERGEGAGGKTPGNREETPLPTIGCKRADPSA